jgi:dephospho-CoA kinase
VARLLVGLTGGLASGKSTVAGRFAAAGFTTVDADLIVAELHRANGVGPRAVADLFGSDFLRPDGATDADRLASLVFSDPSAREKLETVLHPLVRQRFAEIAAAAEGVAVLEATKLVESGAAPEFDVVVTVEADAPTRIRWAARRGLAEGEARARIAAQGGDRLRIAAADHVIRNDGTLDDLLERTDEVVGDLQRRAGS